PGRRWAGGRRARARGHGGLHDRPGRPAGQHGGAPGRLGGRLPSGDARGHLGPSTSRYPGAVTPAELSLALHAVLTSAVADGALPLAPEAVPATVTVERPRSREHGDWATNVAMQVAK